MSAFFVSKNFKNIAELSLNDLFYSLCDFESLLLYSFSSASLLPAENVCVVRQLQNLPEQLLIPIPRFAGERLH
jgi:hypothetical protein